MLKKGTLFSEKFWFCLFWFVPFWFTVNLENWYVSEGHVISYIYSVILAIYICHSWQQNFCISVCNILVSLHVRDSAQWLNLLTACQRFSICTFKSKGKVCYSQSLQATFKQCVNWLNEFFCWLWSGGSSLGLCSHLSPYFQPSIVLQNSETLVSC